MEQHYVFLKDNRVENIAVFATQDEVLADAVAREHGYDDAVWVGENKPQMHSTYDGATFTDPTDEWLISAGMMAPPFVEETTEVVE
jgi:hypothetical protein